jgi:hypothetical protein
MAVGLLLLGVFGAKHSLEKRKEMILSVIIELKIKPYLGTTENGIF